MKNVLLALTLLLGLFLMQSCYYDNPPEIAKIECSEVSYSTHIQPIFNASCATSGCHDGTREPNLKTSEGYNALRAGGFVNLTFPEESSLLKTVDFTENPMPPGGPKLPELERELILCWLMEGARNN